MFIQPSLGPTKVSKIAKTWWRAEAAVNGGFFTKEGKGIGVYVSHGEIRNDTIYPSKPSFSIFGVKKNGSPYINTVDDVEPIKTSGEFNFLIWASTRLVKDNMVAVKPDLEGVSANILERNPRTVVGYKDDGTIFFVTVDGRSWFNSGTTLYETAEFLANKLGVKDAVNLDGGGSSTLYWKGRVRNCPSGFFQRKVPNALCIYEGCKDKG